MSNVPEFPSSDQFETVADRSQNGEGQAAVQFDDSSAQVTYANMLRLHTSPEEFAVDFAHIPNPALLQGKPLQVTQRIVLSPFNAKRLLGMLAQAVKRHEDQFGHVEVDVRKRMVK